MFLSSTNKMEGSWTTVTESELSSTGCEAGIGHNRQFRQDLMESMETEAKKVNVD